MYNARWQFHIKCLKLSPGGFCLIAWTILQNNPFFARCYCCVLFLFPFLLHRLPSWQLLLVPSCLQCTAHLLRALFHLGLSNLFCFPACCSYSSVLAHGCMGFVVTYMLQKQELQPVCDRERDQSDLELCWKESRKNSHLAVKRGSFLQHGVETACSKAVHPLLPPG